jgi:hypothetical protein
MSAAIHYTQFSIRLASVLTAIAVVALALVAPRAAQSAPETNPFAALHGSWSGNGVIKKSNGTSERIRCRSTYEHTGPVGLELRLRCASDSYNFDLGASVTYENGAISGSWMEVSRNVTGTIQGRSLGNGRQIQAVAQSAAFSASLTLTTRGNSQSVVILSPGSEVPEVNVALERR